MNSSSSSNEQYVRTLEAIHREAVDSIITINEAGIIESINPATVTLFGYQESELMGKNVRLLMPNPFRDAHDGYLKNYLDTGNAKIIGLGREVVGRRKDGVVFPIHLAVSEIKVGPNRLFAGVIRDLTEFKRLEAQETELGRIIEDSTNEVYFVDADSLRFIQVNHGGRTNLGYSLNELRKMTPADIKTEYSIDSFRAKVEPLISGELETLNFESTHRRKDGTTYEVEVHLQPAAYHGEPALVAIVLDVTKRRMAERALQEQQEAMKIKLEQQVASRTAELRDAQAELVQNEKFSTLGKVSGGIAHEIRNPLNAVKTSAYYLLNAKNASPDKVREHLERIDRQVTLIDNVVTALSDVAKLPAANLRPFDLEPVIRNAVKSIHLPSNIQVEFEFPDQLPKVLVDENQILIAIKNLVRNARDAMHDGGTLTLSADVDDERVTFSFADTGVGIAAENLGKILEPLYTTKARGMGLGLSITRAIAEKNECALSIESELGKGSRFGISLRREGNQE